MCDQTQTRALNAEAPTPGPLNTRSSLSSTALIGRAEVIRPVYMDALSFLTPLLEVLSPSCDGRSKISRVRYFSIHAGKADIRLPTWFLASPEYNSRTFSSSRSRPVPFRHFQLTTLISVLRAPQWPPLSLIYTHFLF
jgi:hypothetical protein